MKPIILTTREIRGLLDGSITTIRRPIKPQPKLFYGGVAKIIYGRHPFGSDQISEAVGYEVDSGIKAGAMAWLFEDWCGNVVGVADENWLKPPFQPGDVLYVRESGGKIGDKYYYKADPETDAQDNISWDSPATMPREAARLFLRVEETAADKAEKWDWVFTLRTISGEAANETDT